ncbi:MAG: glycoside hydrolase family 16 protein [Bacteroidota bacterium]|nr:glycoside hydrolase family 16 protein [Bacteroidota bacterium]
MKVNWCFFCLIGATSVVSIGCKTFRTSDGANAFSSENYRLVWSDEFNKKGTIDTANWQFEKGFVRNEEDQWYQPENAWCEKGNLIIEGRKEMKGNSNFVKGSSSWKTNRENIRFTAASINTSGKHSWMYGRFVMRGKIDISSGIWPAWWTLGVNGRWPANGEIDIMEYYRKKLLANIACIGSNGKTQWFSNTFSIDSLGGKNWASKYHIWRMDWDEYKIALYLDEQLLNTIELSRLVNKDESGINPFQQPHYMLLNLAIGGLNGGDPLNTKFPVRFKIDYVRVYQKQ